MFPRARFWIFFHFGLYTLQGVNENDSRNIPTPEHEQLRRRFNPRGCDADAWVRLAGTAGERYIGITAKHA